MRTLVLKSVTLLVLVSFLSLSVMADETERLSSVVKTKVDRVTGLIKDPTLEKAQKDAEIIASIEEVIDFALMARISLGKQHWQQLNKAKRKAYTDLFVKRVKASYLEKLYLYTDEKVEVAKGVQKKSNRIEVPSYILGKTDKTEVLYKFYRTKQGDWLVYDLEVAGVSVTQTYRSQFEEFLKSASIDALMDRLRSTEPI